jgi:antitoxin component of MazEF toxin-antitoxin module
MVVKLRKTGNSLAITIPQKLITEYSLQEGDLLQIESTNGIKLTPVEITSKLEPRLHQKLHEEIDRFKKDLDILSKAKK